MFMTPKKTSIREFEKCYPGVQAEIHVWSEKVVTTHGHDYYEIAICERGKLLHVKNDEGSILSRGQAVFLRPGDFHSMEMKEPDSSHINVSVSSKKFGEICAMLDTKDAEMNFPFAITLTEEEFDLVKNRTTEILRLSAAENENVYKEMLYMFAVELAFFFVKRKNRISGDGNSSEPPAWLKEFLNKVCSPEYFECRLSEIYKYSNYSQPVIGAAVKKYYNETFSQYFTNEKIRYACGLLKKTDKTTAEISNLIGFASLSHFNKVFRKITGVTPTEYREKEC